MTDHSAERVIAVYRRHGRDWAMLRGVQLVERTWLDRFCGLLPDGADLLDIGCGSGVPIARELVRRGLAVTGIDAAPEMLALFRANLPGTSSLVSDMRQLALGKAFAGLLAWDSFFHLAPADQRAMFARFRDHAAAGAALMFTSGPGYGETVGTLGGDALYHASLDPAEYRALLDAAGFRVIDHVVEDPQCGDRTIWLAQRHA